MPFQLEFVSTLIEVHLLQHGFSEQAAAYWYSALTLAFFLASLGVALLPAWCDKRLLMLTGLLLFGVAFLMLGPWEGLFASRWFIAASLPLSGVASALAGGKTYIVPTLPHMLEIMERELNTKQDDRLHDALSAAMGISENVGEVLGPLCAGLLAEFFAVASLTNALAIGFFAFAGLYGLLSGRTRPKPAVFEPLLKEMFVQV